MNETTSMLLDMLQRLLEDSVSKDSIAAAEKGEWPSALWSALEEAGLPLMAVPEAAGGVGLDWSDAMLVLREAGRFAAPVPLAETLLANWLLAGAGLEAVTVPATIAPVRRDEALRLERDGAGWRLSGEVSRVPFARNTLRLALVAGSAEGPMVVSLPADAGFTLTEETNLAGEPRDRLVFAAVPVAAADVARAGQADPAGELFLRGALARTAQLAGAAQRTLAMSVTYAGERVQFGRPIAKFQAVQQQLAIAAGQVAAAGAAADFGARGLGHAEAGRSRLAIAMAKCRAGETASQAAAIAHQTHGAIGFTYEHALHQLTRRIWSWREEFGAEVYWAAEVGRAVLDPAAGDIWDVITAA